MRHADPSAQKPDPAAAAAGESTRLLRHLVRLLARQAAAEAVSMLVSTKEVRNDGHIDTSINTESTTPDRW
ncbi:hypothetical protein [Limobrevibacterium gyesilva]|uniref:hypothetical protein n=1 Tax=Limobrevibacterium gyesilva TaxID=2991712 RepID=UPI002227E140|nr:hypothetical protein [Limobrevibacterium gyesilva]